MSSSLAATQPMAVCSLTLELRQAAGRASQHGMGVCVPQGEGRASGWHGDRALSCHGGQPLGV